MRKPDRILGVDWSGARDAGRRAYIAAGRRAGGGAFRLVKLVRGDALPGSGADRATFYRALAEHIRAQGRCAIGFDFPFGLPLELVDESDWLTFARRFPERHPTAEHFRDACRARACGRELKRRTDILTRTPFCAYNLRMYRQTYWGLCGVLSPLVASGEVCALPMQPATHSLPWLIETCPASTLKRLDLYRPYMGREDDRRAQRRAILEHLTGAGRLIVDEDDDTEAMLGDTGGDALDAVIAAVATAWAVRDPAFPRLPEWDERYRMEAVVYAG